MKHNVNKYAVYLLGVTLCMVSSAAPSRSATSPGNEYLDMDISQLMRLTITSVAKKPQNLSDAAAAVFVITQDDIHRSGVSSIPEALRMVPGLQVARIGAEKWAITSRGFNGQTANKLLVLMDGRTLYTPGFSGVYWNVQDTLLEDIDRIEVIRGPGGTIWGANAVNGIINIITKKASDTKGGLVRVAAGNKERFSGGLRYGAKISDLTHARAYLTYRDHDSFTLHGTEDDANDNWESVRAGFRLDGEALQKDSWTLQGDIYTQDANQLVSPHITLEAPYISQVPDNYDASGWNMLAKWQHQLSTNNSWTIQSYYDFSHQDELFIGQTHKIFDIEFQHQFQLSKYHELIWGIGYRNIQSNADKNTFQLSFFSENMSIQLFSGFIQDEINLIQDRLWLTLGSKIEHHDYTGYEIQPSGRLLFKPSTEQTIWAAVSRAVRTPNNIERNSRLTIMMIPDMPPFPAAVFLYGNQEYDSEEVFAYELGYRILPAKQLSLDIALFYNEYNNLRTSTPLTLPSTSEIQFENKSQGSSYGFELASDWKPLKWITFQFGYTYLQMDLDVNDGGTGTDIAVVYEDSSPHHQVSLRSSIDIGKNWQMNLWLRYVDQFAASGLQAISQQTIIDEYLSLDANISWHPRENLELMLVGQNLFSSDRMEFISEYLAPATEIEPSVFGKLTYHF